MFTLLWSFEIQKVIQGENLTVAEERIEEPHSSFNSGVIGGKDKSKRWMIQNRYLPNPFLQ